MYYCILLAKNETNYPQREETMEQRLELILRQVEQYVNTHYMRDADSVSLTETPPFYKMASSTASGDVPISPESEVLHRIILGASPAMLEEIFKMFPPGTQERSFLENKAKAILEKTGKNFCSSFDADDMIDTIGDTLDYALSDMSFYETLVLFIVESGYRKVSDFYNRMGIDHRYWHRYKKGFIPPKKRLMEMIFFLQLGYEDAEYLMNVGGYVFQRNSVTDVIVLYFLKNGYAKQMPPEELLILVDEVLINFNQDPIHSDES